MAVSTGRPGNNEVSAWSPTKIAREVLRAREANLPMSKRGTDYSEETHEGGQVLSLPELDDLNAFTIGPNGEITFQAQTETAVSLIVNQYKSAGFAVRDDAGVQSVVNIQRQKSPKVGYAMAKDVEDYVQALEASLGGTQAINITGDIAEANIRRGVQYLDDADAPFDSRYFQVSPGQHNALLAIDKFSNADFMSWNKPGQSPVLTHKLTLIHGCEPIMTTRTRRRSVSGTTRTICPIWQEGAFGFAMQKKITMEMQRQGVARFYFGTVLYGAIITRDNHWSTLQTTNA